MYFFNVFESTVKLQLSHQDGTHAGTSLVALCTSFHLSCLSLLDIHRFSWNEHNNKPVGVRVYGIINTFLY